MCCTSLRREGFPTSSRLFSRCLATVMALFSFAPLASAQVAATGPIRARAQTASNGAFLENVTVQVAGANEVAKTNQYGDYVIRGVPAGEVVLKANYVGEPEQTATITVTAGTDATRDFTFRESADTKRLDNGTIMLDPFKVSAERYANARAIA